MKSRNIRSFYSSVPALLTLALIIAVASAPAFAGLLSTSGQLQLPANCPGDACGSQSTGLFPHINQNNNTFIGTFPNNADPAYGGFFKGTGPYPNTHGTNTFDFTKLTAGFLPAGSILYLGDLDDGGGLESFTFKAFGSSGQITTPWINSPFYVSSPNPADLVQGSMPEYTWSGGAYTFDGDHVAGNPSLGVYLTTAQDVYGLQVVGPLNSASYAFADPTPEPSSLALIGSGVAGIAGLLRRRLSF